MFWLDCLMSDVPSQSEYCAVRRLPRGRVRLVNVYPACGPEKAAPLSSRAFDLRADPAVQAACHALLLGILARLESPASDPAAITAAFRQAAALGHLFAARRSSAVALWRTFRYLHDRLLSSLPPPPPDRAGALAWQRRLTQAVDGFLAVALEAFERQRSAQWAQHAYVDSLTGLFNRTYLQRRLREELRRAARTGQPLTLLLADVDRLKWVNDTRGHAAGDALLRAVGAALQAGVRGHDVVARYGGDEFVVLLLDTALHGGERAARRLLRLVEARTARSGVEGVGVSIGVAGYPAHGREGEALLEAADRALYRAKQGPEKVVVAGGAPSNGQGATRRNAVE
jgi:diguanylate cyclase (GGDEF)-like protein